MKLRILQVLDLYPPILGGAQIQTQLLSKELVRRGHEVAVATIWQDGLREFEMDEGVAIHRLKGLSMRARWLWRDPSRRDSAPLPDPGLTLGIRRLVNKFKPDVVMVYGWIVYSTAAALVGKDIPLVVSSRDYGYSCATRNLMYKGAICSGPEYSKCMECASERWGNVKGRILVGGVFSGRALITRQTAAFQSVSTFVCSVVARDLLRQPADSCTTPDGQHSRNMVIHDLAGDIDTEPPDPDILAQLPDEPFILFVGALAAYKGLHLVLEAYEKMENPPPLVLIGTVWPDTPDTFPDNVTVLRNVPHATVMAAWERALFGLAPSMWPDPLPNVVLEAMSKGKPVIGTRAGGLTDMIVDGETGYLVDLGDVAALAEAMQRLSDDTALREQFGRASRERIDAIFASDVVVTQFEDLFQRLAANGQK